MVYTIGIFNASESNSSEFVEKLQLNGNCDMMATLVILIFHQRV